MLLIRVVGLLVLDSNDQIQVKGNRLPSFKDLISKKAKAKLFKKEHFRTETANPYRP